MDTENSTLSLYNDYAGHSVVLFKHINVIKSPDTLIWVSMVQWRDGLEKQLDKLLLDAFIKKYIDQGAFLHFDPMSTVSLKLECTEACEFEFDLHCQLDVREHEPVYL